jgi:hypothetical protein
MAKNKNNMETSSEEMPVTDEQPIKRLADFTAEAKLARVSEELISLAGDYLFDREVVINGFESVEGGLYTWSDILVQDWLRGDGTMIHVMTNSPEVAKKLSKVITFPVLAKFTRRSVRGKFKYDLE